MKNLLKATVQKGSMGIKNIHIALISCSVIVSLVFGFWAMGHNYQMLGATAVIAAVALVVYGISFLKKVKML